MLNEHIECRAGQTDFSSSELKINRVFNGTFTTQRTGICSECKRKWNLWRPEATKTANLTIKIKDSQVASCIRLNTD